MSARRFASDCSKSRRRLISAIEPVEPRRLLATLVGTDLRIEGTAGNDRVRVETIGATVVVTQNSVAQSFNKTKVKTINANLRAGNDRIDIVWNVLATTTISGEGGNDTVIGGDYKDVIYTGSGNDFVYGGRGGDFIQTSTGNDFISPGSQNDTVDAGDGIDEVSYANRATAIRGELKVVAFYDVPFNFELSSRGSMTAGSESDVFTGAETLTGGKADDNLTLTVTGTPNSPFAENTFRINGGDGNDSLSGSSWYDTIPRWLVRMIADGGNGADRLTFYVPGEATLIGGAGDDEFYSVDSDARVPTIDAGAGIDSFTFGRINPRVTMAPGLENLTITRAFGSTIVAVGNDLSNTIRVLDAAGFSAGIEGRGGNDTIIGSAGDDSILGGEGNDLIQPGLGNDTIEAGDGEDEVSYSDRSTSIAGSINALLLYVDADPNLPLVAGWSSRGEVRDGSEIDLMTSSEILTGSGVNDTLSLEVVDGFNGTSSDSPFRSKVYRLNGGDGDDSLRATCLNDFYPGGVARITLDGGAGADYFNTYAICSVIGGVGDDYVYAAQDDDATAPSIDAGLGIDTFEFSRFAARYVMPAGLENLTISATTYGRVVVTGNDLNNVIIAQAPQAGSWIYGRGGDDLIRFIGYDESQTATLRGGTGNDTLIGGGAADFLFGDEGNDLLDGRGGNDLIDGGDGFDTAIRDPDDTIVDSIELLM